MLVGQLLGCSTYQGTARSIDEAKVTTERGWQRVKLDGARQSHDKDCGAAALSSVLQFWGKTESVETVDRALRQSPNVGLRAGDLRDYARQHNLSAYVFFGDFADLRHELQRGRPVIVGLIKPRSNGELFSHYEVVIGHNPERQRVLTWDPALGLQENSERGFSSEWATAKRVTLVVFDPSRDADLDRTVNP
jgi:predicted double-glycine peptidase